MMDHDLHQQEPLLGRKKRLAHDRRQMSVRVRQQSGCENGHQRLPHRPDAVLVEPSADLPVMRPETPVLVHHQPHALRPFAHQRAGLLVARSERLLAEHGHAV
jgi:hypothetical protein